MASVLGMLEEQGAAARVRVEGLREEVARLAEVLEAAEIELDRRVITGEELVEALAVSAAEATAVSEAEKEAAPLLAPVPGSMVPPWREGLPVTALASDCQRILGVLEQRRSAGHGSLRAREITVELGLGTTPARVKGVRSKTRRLAERGWLLLETSGAFSAGRQPVAVPGTGRRAAPRCSGRHLGSRVVTARNLVGAEWAQYRLRLCADHHGEQRDEQGGRAAEGDTPTT
ncbi:hypothetical protein ACIRQP_32205 [Streptomyces sp. NPDC102274]|uniref:hypothetical protein n=1 Tax=Streptomyces sp. NPDC102274 TaxID=3366151 RepID=UPI0037FEE0B5